MMNGGINKFQGFMDVWIHEGYDVCDVNLISVVKSFMC